MESAGECSSALSLACTLEDGMINEGVVRRPPARNFVRSTSLFGKFGELFSRAPACRQPTTEFLFSCLTFSFPASKARRYPYLSSIGNTPKLKKKTALAISDLGCLSSLELFTDWKDAIGTAFYSFVFHLSFFC